MSEKHWKEQWEAEADAELKALGTVPLPELIRRIQEREFGGSYVIWDAVAVKKDLPAVGWVLYDFLASSAEYLHRYHCARALLNLLSCTRYQPADLTVVHRQPAKALKDIESMLERAIGRRGVG